MAVVPVDEVAEMSFVCYEGEGADCGGLVRVEEWRLLLLLL